MGILQAVTGKIKEKKQFSANKKEFLEALLQAAADGKLSTAEVTQLNGLKTQFALSDADVHGLGMEVYQAAIAAAKSDGVVTLAEFNQIADFQRYLGLPDEEVQAERRELARLGFLNQIQGGTLPTREVPGLILQKGEVCHWVEHSAQLLEEKVVSRHYEGGSSGVSVRIMKGVSYRVGSQRGHLVSEKAVVAVSSGELILTNKRAIFRGTRKSFAVALSKLLGLDVYTDGIRLTEGSGKHRVIRLPDVIAVNTVAAVLNLIVNR